MKIIEVKFYITEDGKAYVSREEAEKSSPMTNAIRGIENLSRGKKYVKHYGSLGFTEGPFEYCGSCKDEIGTILIFRDGERKIHESYAGDCGVLPYKNGYNKSNFLVEAA